jgi:hypothetical protein
MVVFTGKGMFVKKGMHKHPERAYWVVKTIVQNGIGLCFSDG